MLISKADIIGHLADRLDVIAKQCVASRDMTHDQTQYERGRYAAHKEIVSWLETHYSED